jgi:selenocysteine-specific elongation factor
MYTIGGGIILDPVPEKKKPDREEYMPDLLLLETRDPGQLITWQLRKQHAVGSAEPDFDRFGILYRLDWKKALDKLLSDGDVIDVEVRGIKRYILVSVYRELEETVMGHLERFHQNFPLKPGMRLSGFHSLYGGSLDKDFLRIVLEKMVDEGKLEWDREFLKIKGTQIQLSPVQQEIWSHLEKILMESRFTPPLLSAVTESTGFDEKTLETVLNVMSDADMVEILSNKIVYHRKNLDIIIDNMIGILQEKKRIGVADIKNHFGITRKYAIPILEYTDQIRLTRREGDARVQGEKFSMYQSRKNRNGNSE